MHGKAIAPSTFVWCKTRDSKPTLLSSTKTTQKMEYHHATYLLPLTQSNQARERERKRGKERERKRKREKEREREGKREKEREGERVRRRDGMMGGCRITDLWRC